MTVPEAEVLRRLPIATKIAKDAGALLLGYFGHLDGYMEKSRANLVTKADQESEALVTDAFQKALPDDLLLCEEGDGFEGALARREAIEAAPYCWCVDPLDGTTNFVHGYPHFCVSLGLLHKGRPVLGVVYNPYREELYTGGIHVNPERNGEPIHVSSAKIDAALVATGFPYDRRERMDELLGWLRNVLQHVHGVRRVGAAAMDICDVAAGRLDGFYEVGLSPWDIAAAQAILEAAGGRLTGFDGGEHDLFGRHSAATNGAIHGALVECLTRPAGL